LSEDAAPRVIAGVLLSPGLLPSNCRGGSVSALVLTVLPLDQRVVVDNERLPHVADTFDLPRLQTLLERPRNHRLRKHHIFACKSGTNEHPLALTRQ
jgi:hypothetical protein